MGMSDKSRSMIAASQSAPTGGKRSGFRTLVGYRTLVWRDGYAEIVLDVGPVEKSGIVHGGVYATLLDAACGHAATWVSVEGNIRRCVTLSLTTSFLATARSGPLVAVGRLEAIRDRVGTLTAEVRDDAGTVFAVGQASFRYERGSERTEGVSRT